MDRRTERLVVSILAALLIAAGSSGTLADALEWLDVDVCAIATALGIVLLVYAIELAVTNALYGDRAK